MSDDNNEPMIVAAGDDGLPLVNITKRNLIKCDFSEVNKITVTMWVLEDEIKEVWKIKDFTFSIYPHNQKCAEVLREWECSPDADSP